MRKDAATAADAAPNEANGRRRKTGRAAARSAVPRPLVLVAAVAALLVLARRGPAARAASAAERAASGEDLPPPTPPEAAVEPEAEPEAEAAPVAASEDGSPEEEAEEEDADQPYASEEDADVPDAGSAGGGAAERDGGACAERLRHLEASHRTLAEEARACAEAASRPPDCGAAVREAAAERAAAEDLRAALHERSQHAETCQAALRDASTTLEQRDKAVRLLQERARSIQLHSESLQAQLERSKQDLFEARRENHRLTEHVSEAREAWWNFPERGADVARYVNRHWQRAKERLERGWRVVEPYWNAARRVLEVAHDAASRAWYGWVVPHWQKHAWPRLVQLARCASHHSHRAHTEGRLLVQLFHRHLRTHAAAAYEASQPHRARLQQTLQPHWDEVSARVTSGREAAARYAEAAGSALEKSSAGRALAITERSCRAWVASSADAALLRFLHSSDDRTEEGASPASWAVRGLQVVRQAAQPPERGGVPAEWVFLAVTLWVLVAVPRVVRWMLPSGWMKRGPTRSPPSRPVRNGSASAATTNGSASATRNGTAADAQHRPHPQPRRTVI